MRRTPSSPKSRAFGAHKSTAWQWTPQGVSLVRPPQAPRPVRLPTHTDVIELDVLRSALVVVDMQNDFCHPEGWFAQKGVSMRATRKPIPVLSELLPAWRHAGGRVVWLNWGVRADTLNLSPTVRYKAARPDANGHPGVGYAQVSPIDHGPSVVPGSWGSQVVDELVPSPGDITVFKHRLSGFHDNELDSILRQQGITTLLFGGVNTDRCVYSTLQDAGFLGYDCVLLKDACATPSPAYVTRAIHFLVDKLHGFVGTAEALIPALTACSSNLNATPKDPR
jgi:ureidoacrylate peracid hydrolase